MTPAIVRTATSAEWDAFLANPPSTTSTAALAAGIPFEADGVRWLPPVDFAGETSGRSPPRVARPTTGPGEPRPGGYRTRTAGGAS